MECVEGSMRSDLEIKTFCTKWNVCSLSCEAMVVKGKERESEKKTIAIGAKINVLK